MVETRALIPGKPVLKASESWARRARDSFDPSKRKYRTVRLLRALPCSGLSRTLLEKHGAKLRKLDLTVAEIKYDARRAKTSEERLAKVEKGFKAASSRPFHAWPDDRALCVH